MILITPLHFVMATSLLTVKPLIKTLITTPFVSALIIDSDFFDNNKNGLQLQAAQTVNKPLAFGQIENAAFIGLPGNPVSVFVTFCIFARPFLLRSQGVMEVAPRSYWVEANFDWTTPDRRREYLRARLDPGMDGVSRATIFPHQGSGVLTSTVWGDGLINCPAGTPIKRGERVRFIPFSELMAWH